MTELPRGGGDTDAWFGDSRAMLGASSACDDSSDTATISGAVTSDDASAKPIRGVTVTLTASDGPFMIVAFTADDGSFAFDGLAPGSYRLSAKKAAYLQAEFGAMRLGRPGKSLVLTAGQKAATILRLTRGSVIAGKVNDSRGHPIVGAYVRVLSLSATSGEQVLATAKGGVPVDVETDEFGRYRVYGLMPGDYFVGTTAGIGGAGFAGHDLTDAEIASTREEIGGTTGQVRPSSAARAP